MVDPKAHQLYKQVPGTDLEVAASVEGAPISNGWKFLNTFDCVFRSYIDLAGWSRQSLTTFTQGIDIQKSNLPLLSGQANVLIEFDFITTRRLTDTEVASTLVGPPGYLPSTVDLMEVIYGERMQYAENATIPGTMVQIGGETFGSGNPTAMNRLHWTRYYAMLNSAPTDTMAVGPTNLIVQAMTVEEKDLVWIERLRRSYVQQEAL